jgi:histidinol-phosphatase (PHP family)
MFSDIIHSDNHVHTYFSTDSDTPMEDMLKTAIEKGFSSICFTDHMDYNFPSEDDTPEFLLDVEPYFEEMKRLNEKYGGRIKIRQGIELGLKKDCLDKCLSLTKEYPFDFVIGSTHLVDNIDPYYDTFWSDTPEKSGILRYYETTLNNVNLGADFDVYGHIDYIIRYTPKMKQLKSQGLSDDTYINRLTSDSMDIIEQILKTLIYNGKGIEINTAGFKYGLGHPNPHEKILKLYCELGGEIITIGSDAHECKHLAYDFEKVPEILKKCGFRYYSEFTGRKAEMIKM